MKWKSEQSPDAVHLRDEVNDIIVGGFSVESEVLQNHMFPSCKSVSCRVVELQQTGSRMILGEADRLFDEAKEYQGHTGVPCFVLLLLSVHLDIVRGDNEAVQFFSSSLS